MGDHRAVLKAMKTLSILPIVCYGLIVAYACYAAAVVGHWPYYAHPDPKDLPLRGLVYVADIILLIGLVTVVLVPIVYGAYRTKAAWSKVQVPPHRAAVGLYCFGALSWVADVAAEFANLPWKSLAGWVAD